MKSVYCVAEFEKFVIYQPQSRGYRSSSGTRSMHDEECAPLRIKLFLDNEYHDGIVNFMDENRSSTNEDLLNNFDSACNLENPNWKPICVRIYPDCIKIEFANVRSYDSEENEYDTEVITFSTRDFSLKITIPRAMEGSLDEYKIHYRDRFCNDCDIQITEAKHYCIFYEWRVKRHTDGKYYVHYEMH